MYYLLSIFNQTPLVLVLSSPFIASHSIPFVLLPWHIAEILPRSALNEMKLNRANVYLVHSPLDLSQHSTIFCHFLWKYFSLSDTLVRLYPWISYLSHLLISSSTKDTQIKKFFAHWFHISLKVFVLTEYIHGCLPPTPDPGSHGLWALVIPRLFHNSVAPHKHLTPHVNCVCLPLMDIPLSFLSSKLPPTHLWSISESHSQSTHSTDFITCTFRL